MAIFTIKVSAWRHEDEDIRHTIEGGVILSKRLGCDIQLSLDDFTFFITPEATVDLLLSSYNEALQKKNETLKIN